MRHATTLGLLLLVLAAAPAARGEEAEGEAPPPAPAASPTGTPQEPPAESPAESPAEESSSSADVPPEPEPATSRRRAPRPWAPTTLSVFLPGGGFLLLDRPGRTLGYLGVETLELGAVVATIATSGYDPDDPTTEDRLNRVLLPGVWLQNTHFVGIYDTYRHARMAVGNEGYSTPIPQPGLPGLLRAPLRFRQALRPEVGIPLGLVAAAGLTFSLVYDAEPTFWEQDRLPLFSQEVDRWTAFAAAEAYWTTSFYAVGIGEEALFRGVLQTSLEELLGPTWGWITASVLFGALHAFNAPESWQTMAAAATVTGTVGGYLGWLYQLDGYDLSAGIFFHTWYDVVVGTTFFLADPEHQPISARIAIPF